MKQTTLKLIGLLFASMIAYGGDEAQITVNEPSFDLPYVETALDASSASIWRGVDVGDETAAVEIASNLEIFEEYTIGVNAITRVTDTESEDFIGTLNVERQLESWLIGLSQTWYSRGFDRSGPSSSELGLHISRLFGPVTVSLSQYLATAGDNDGYAGLEAAYSSNFDVLPIVLDFNAELGYLTERGRFSHAGVEVSTMLPFVEGFSLKPFVGATVELSDTSGVFNNTGNQLYGGFQIKKTF